MDISGHDSDLAFTGCNHAGTIRANQPAAALSLIAFDLDHIEHRHALSYTNDQLDAGGDGFENGVGSKWRRNVNHGPISAGCLARLFDGVENRDALKVAAALAWHHAANHLGAILFAGASMNLASCAGDTLG